MYANIKSFISPFQHSVTTDRSTVANVACFMQYINENFDDQEEIDIFTDF